MPKAKLTPKTEKLWMLYDSTPGIGFIPPSFGFSKSEAIANTKFPLKHDQYFLVRIVPEAEYQRMRKEANHIPDVNKMVTPTTEAKA